MGNKIIGWVLFLVLVGLIMFGIVESTNFVFDVIYGGKISSLMGSLFLYIIDIALIIVILILGYMGINYVNTKFLNTSNS